MALVSGYSSSEEDTTPVGMSTLNPTPLDVVVALEAHRPQVKRTFAATVETHHYDPASFDFHYRAYGRPASTPQTRKQKKMAKAKRKNGPFGGFTSDESEADSAVALHPEEQIMPVVEGSIGSPRASAVADSDSDDAEEPSTRFFGTSERDYLGRSYMHVPVQFPRLLERECFVPKRAVHTTPAAHARGVTKLVFFPSGHLLLSCGNDATVKLWDVATRALLRGYYGHTKPVKDIAFNPSGSQFASCGYDRMVRVWDVESGAIQHSFQIKGTPNAVLFNPQTPSELLIGCSSGKIYHYDTRQPVASAIVQTYDHHLASIQSLTAIDGGARFMSTSEDKSIRMWDWGANVPLKTISDPAQYNMPCVALHPKAAFAACQGMDNRVHVVLTTEKYKLNRRKHYVGHLSQGYAIGVAFSPDGKTLVSGDSRGRAFFWDWLSNKVVKQLQVDPKQGVLNCVASNPAGVSDWVMAGGSGAIYYYE